MNKKIIYSLVLTSIFVLSIASVAIQPVAGAKFKFGVPDAAKGMKLQSEVKIYDKDTWGDCLGPCRDNSVNEKYGGDGSDANDVGSRSQSEISDWESDDIWFFGDFLMESDVPVRCDGSTVSFAGFTLTNYWSAVDAVYAVLNSMGQYAGTRATTYADFVQHIPMVSGYLYPGNTSHGRMGILESVIAITALQGRPDIQAYWAAFSDPYISALYTQAKALTDLFADSTFTKEEVSALYNKKYEGVILTRDSWDFAKDLTDLEDDPDEEDQEAPFIEDPKDLYDSFLYFNDFLNDEFLLIDQMIYSLIALNATFQASAGSNYWYGVNNTIGKLINGSIIQGFLDEGYSAPVALAMAAQTWEYFFLGGLLTNCFDTMIDAYLNADGTHPMQSGAMGLMGIVPFFVDETPQDDKEYVRMLLDGGIPASQPVDHWLERLLDAFDIDEDRWFGDDDTIYQDITLYYATIDATGIKPKSVTGVYVSDDLQTGGIEVDGLVVTCEVEWQEPLLNDPKDPDSQREDYDIVWTYGDTGGQSKTEYFKGDECFYSIEGISPTIVGYEVSILLGAGAIATLGLIYVVIKKRRM